MLSNVCRSLVGASLFAFVVGCGGGEPPLPTSPQPLSPALQEMKADILKKQQERLAHKGRSKGHQIRNPLQR
jgi:hypothetical protein